MAVGSLAGRLPESLAGSLPPSPYGFDPDAILRSLGVNLLHWWEPRADQTTLNGSNISQIDNLVSGGGALVQATASNQPAWVNDGSGPNGRPYASLQDTARYLSAAVSLATNHRTGVYVVVQHASSGAVDRYAAALTTASAAVVIDYSRNAASPHGVKLFADFNAGTDFNGRVDDYNGAWLLWALRPLAAGARMQVDGADTATQPSNTNGLIAATNCTLGYSLASTSGGAVAGIILTTEPVAAIDDVVKNYVAARFGLTLA